MCRADYPKLLGQGGYRDIASSEDFVPQESQNGFPFVGVYAGELESLTGHDLLDRYHSQK